MSGPIGDRWGHVCAGKPVFLSRGEVCSICGNDENHFYGERLDGGFEGTRTWRRSEIEELINDSLRKLAGHGTPDHPPRQSFDWNKHIKKWEEVWQTLTTAEEFEKLRNLDDGPLSDARYDRMRHLERHLDRGELLCKCGKDL